MFFFSPVSRAVYLDSLPLPQYIVLAVFNINNKKNQQKNSNMNNLVFFAVTILRY